MRFADVVAALEELAPPELSEEWDNTGLLLGDVDSEVRSILTCLTLTPDVAEEAISGGAQLIVTHHPILFRAVKRITSATSEGKMLLELTRAGIAVYSPHTSWDSAAGGINRQLAELLELSEIAPLREIEGGELTSGAGRFGRLSEPVSLGELCERVKSALSIDAVQYVGDAEALVSTIGIACGAAGEFLEDAVAADCDVFLTGESRFHTYLEAESRGIAMVLPGHYATERHAMETLASRLADQFPAASISASAIEKDPLKWI